MISLIGKFYTENGLILTIQECVNLFYRRMYNAMLSGKIEGSPKINIHPSAYIRGLKHIQIGTNFSAARNLWLEAVTLHRGEAYNPKIVIGNNVGVNENVHIAATHSVMIGNDVLMASRIYISDHHHGNYSGEFQSNPDVPPNDRPVTADSKVVIGDRVWIGEMVSILAGVTIGEGSIIGSGSVVAKDIPPHCIAVGSPARVIKRFDVSEKKWIPVPRP